MDIPFKVAGKVYRVLCDMFESDFNHIDFSDVEVTNVRKKR